MSMTLVAAAFRIAPEASASASSVEHLYDQVFGPPRFQKASHQFRTDVPPIRHLSWIVREDDRVIGAIRYWSILIGETETPALLLGPLAVTPDRKCRGIGTALITKTLTLARQAGHDIVLLVGDPDYYKRFGFRPATPCGFTMPCETRPERLQVISLQGNALLHAGGVLRRAERAIIARAS